MSTTTRTYYVAFRGRLAGHTPFASGLTLDQALRDLGRARRQGHPPSDVEILADLSDADLRSLRDEAAAAGDERMVDTCDAALAGDHGFRRIASRAVVEAAIAALD